MLFQVNPAAQLHVVELTVPVVLAIAEQFTVQVRDVRFQVQPDLHVHELIPLLIPAPGISGQLSWQAPPFQK